MPRRGRPSKHTLYYALLDACKPGGCPICVMTQGAVARYLESVLYENVNDPPTRDAVIQARGYCNNHSWALREMQGALGVALMYRDVLRHVAEELESMPSSGRLDLFGAQGQGSLFDRLTARAGGSEANGKGQVAADPHRACPACQTRDRYEQTYLETLLDHVEDEEMQRSFRASGGLCLIHLDRVATARNDAAPRRLFALQRACMAALHDELSEFIRKHDYRFQGERIGAEGTSWLRAVEMVAGKPGIR